ncbi:MAG: hypothetical protein QM652_00605 [Legionella sp.]
MALNAPLLHVDFINYPIASAAGSFRLPDVIVVHNSDILFPTIGIE